MGSKVWAFVNWGFLVVVIFIAIWMVWGFPQGGEDDGEVVLPEDCIDVNDLEGFEYEACYDAYWETIFLKVSRDKAEYQIDNLDISFVDLASQFYSLDVPGAGEEMAYRILAKKSPGSVKIVLDVVQDFSGSVCGGKSVFVGYCPAGTGGEGVDVSISPIGGVGIRDFIEVKDFPDFASDVIVMDLVEKEAIWESTCKSNWDCGEWEACEEGVQRRSCKDLNNCIIPTDSPVSVQRCDGSCIENWECEWTGCEDGISVPECRDLNSCGTSFDIPKELSCEERGVCLPNIVCSDWTECDVDYDFIDLVGYDQVMHLDGSKTRLCIDKNGCVATQKEEKVCSIGVDIYTKRFERCGEDYIGVYNVLDNSTLAILEEGVGEKTYLNIYFNDQDGVYCDFCFDGEMNGDEEGLDCGGSCRKCEEDVYVERNWWDFIFDF